jgi:hypothetical protein
MPANPPTKIPDAPAEKPAEKKFDRYRPNMPEIPGVKQGSGSGAGGLSDNEIHRLFLIGGVVVAVVLIGAVLIGRYKSNARSATNSSPESSSVQQSAPTPAPSSDVPEFHEGPNVAATVEELSKPWDAKKFTFVNPLTRDNVDAMVMRLPGGGLWAFSLHTPFGRCELEYVTDLGALASQYRFNASHPMVASPCDGTLFDPLKVGPLGGNTWARGEIVQGSGLRPPLSIDVKVSGHSIVADSIEQ